MKPRYMLYAGTMAILLAGAGPVRAQGFWHKKPKPAPAQSTCYAGFPQGLPRLYSGVNTKYLLDYQINFTYNSADAKDMPELAKMFTMVLNDSSQGSGLEYEQAEGVQPNVRITMTAYHNNTMPDHFSLAVQVWGPTSFSLAGGPGGPLVSYFIVDNAPFTYTDGGKMAEDAGILTSNFFKNGWTCSK
ncbi:MAG: hypothetical protein WA405_12385 [Candidatus Acidiferrales bacterium]